LPRIASHISCAAEPIPRERRAHPESVKHEATGWLAAFPDLNFDLEQMIASGELTLFQQLGSGREHTRDHRRGVSPLSVGL
jgi:hypothetical protein